jgi:hypothetical protein
MPTGRKSATREILRSSFRIFRRDVTPGCYYEEEPSSVAEGEYRIPRRRRQED